VPVGCQREYAIFRAIRNFGEQFRERSSATTRDCGEIEIFQQAIHNGRGSVFGCSGTRTAKRRQDVDRADSLGGLTELKGICIRGPTPSREDPRGLQLREHGAHDANGGAELDRQAIGGLRWSRVAKCLRHLKRDSKRDFLSLGWTSGGTTQLASIGREVLMRERKFGAEQHDRPEHVDPAEEQRQLGESAVQRVGFRNADAVAEVRILSD
jgi:hypothetical protein